MSASQRRSSRLLAAPGRRGPEDRYHKEGEQQDKEPHQSVDNGGQAELKEAGGGKEQHNENPNDREKIEPVVAPCWISSPPAPARQRCIVRLQWLHETPFYGNERKSEADSPDEQAISGPSGSHPQRMISAFSSVQFLVNQRHHSEQARAAASFRSPALIIVRPGRERNSASSPVADPSQVTGGEADRQRFSPVSPVAGWSAFSARQADSGVKRGISPTRRDDSQTQERSEVNA